MNFLALFKNWQARRFASLNSSAANSNWLHPSNQDSQSSSGLLWKNINTVWALIEPFILKLIQKNVPNWVTKLYENLAKYTQPAIESLFELKAKIKTTPSELDNYCFTQGVNALDAFASYLSGVVENLRKE